MPTSGNFHTILPRRAIALLSPPTSRYYAFSVTRRTVRFHYLSVRPRKKTVEQSYREITRLAHKYIAKAERSKRRPSERPKSRSMKKHPRTDIPPDQPSIFPSCMVPLGARVPGLIRNPVIRMDPDMGGTPSIQNITFDDLSQNDVVT